MIRWRWAVRLGSMLGVAPLVAVYMVAFTAVMAGVCGVIAAAGR